MKPKTKIICTIGPAVNDVAKMVQLIECGMAVARVNFSHGTHEEHRETISRLKQARETINSPLGIMLDTKGPEIRVGHVKNGGIDVVPGQRLTLVKELVATDDTKLAIRPSIVLDYVKVGTIILIDNGYIQAKVVEIQPTGVVIEFINNGTILSSKGVNIPSLNVPIDFLTEKDISDIKLGCELGVDIIAASFIRNSDDVIAIKKLIAQYNRPQILVLAKIESKEGVRNFDSILEVCDGIMVARGDLGVEVPIYEVPKLQKMMIKKCNLAGKPVVTATQMLESMISNPRPTRAEVSDVANAIYDGTSTVMLSGETAVGHYPLETVSLMQSIIAETEQDFDYEAFFDMHRKVSINDVPAALTLAAVKTAYSIDAKAIFTFSNSGLIARLLSRMKPKMPIVTLTAKESTYHQLSLLWGITPVLCTTVCDNIHVAFREASRYALDNGIVAPGDLAVITAGDPFSVTGTSNTIVVDRIENKRS